MPDVCIIFVSFGTEVCIFLVKEGASKVFIVFEIIGIDF